MKIKAISFKEAVKRMLFLKRTTTVKATKWLKERGVIEADEVFLLMDSKGKLAVKIHTIGEPKEIEFDFKY